MPLFDIPQRGNKEQDMRIANKLKVKQKTPTTVKGGGLIQSISRIKLAVEKYLGKEVSKFELITSKERLVQYIQSANKNGRIAIDTETTGLDPMQDKIVGLCLYTEGEKGAYIPINHVSYITHERVANQLTEADCKYALDILYADVIMFNANFDIRVIKNQLGVRLHCWWDCSLASRLMNENEPKKGLKALHEKYILGGEKEEFNFEALFKGVSAQVVPINTFYLYGANDGIVTYELFKFQEHYLRLDHERKDMRDLAWVFHHIEMPCVDVVVDMEDTGIELDLDYASKLSERYTAQLQTATQRFYDILDSYSSKIETFVRTHKNAKLDNPVNIASPSQIATLLYDVLGVESVDRKSPRGTGEAILKLIAEKNTGGVADVCNAILDYREIAKLISTYIDKLPKCVNPNDGRIHCNFNQYGADTGRFSSSDPKLNWAYM